MNYSIFSTYSCIRYYEFFKLAKLLGGGGGQNDMFAPPPQYFHWGGATAPPPPPRIDASAHQHTPMVKGHFRRLRQHSGTHYPFIFANPLPYIFLRSYLRPIYLLIKTRNVCCRATQMYPPDHCELSYIQYKPPI